MRTSPTIRPSKPSMAMTYNQRICPGKSASSAGKKTASQIAPKDLAIGETIFRERNQRTPSPVAKTGMRNAPIPKNWSIKSKTKAPTTPIQVRAARESVKIEALFSEGSSGEYEANARKRRRAETHNRNPISSLSRRLLVGAKIREKYFIWRIVPRRKTLLPALQNHARARRLCQEIGYVHNDELDARRRASTEPRRKVQHQSPDNNPINRKWHEPMLPHPGHEPRNR